MTTHTLATFAFGKALPKRDAELIFQRLQDGDIVEIKTGRMDIENECYFADKTLTFKGKGKNKTKIYIGNGKTATTAFKLDGQMDLTIKDCTIVVDKYATFIGVANNQVTGRIHLENVRIIYTGQFSGEEIQPSLNLTSQLLVDTENKPIILNLHVEMQNCEAENVIIRCAKVKLDNCSFINPCFGAISEIVAVKFDVRDIVLGNTLLSSVSRSNTILNNVTALYNASLSGLMTVQNLIIKPYPKLAALGDKGALEAFNKQEVEPYKNEPFFQGKDEPIILFELFSDYDLFKTDITVQGFKFDLNDYMTAGLTFDRLHDEFGYTFTPISIWGQSESPNEPLITLQLRDGKLPDLDYATNRAFGCELVMEGVTDKSTWNAYNYSFVARRSSTHLLEGDYLEHKEQAQSDVALTVEEENAPVTNESEKYERTALEELDSLTGLENAKKLIHQMVAVAVMNKQREKLGMPVSQTSRHTVFVGEAGTGKTTVARLYGRALYENGVLPTDKFKEVSRKDLVSNYVGQTAKQTADVCQEALGGILFIDEAYSLQPAETGLDFAKEAIDELIVQMENHRDELIVILAGYTHEMEVFINTANTGLKSRFTSRVVFDSYTDDELLAIFHQLLAKQQSVPENSEVEKLADIGLIKAYRTAYEMNPNATGNARYVRTFVEAISQMRDMRVSRDYLLQDLDVTVLSTYTESDVDFALAKMFDLMRNLS